MIVTPESLMAFFQIIFNPQPDLYYGFRREGNQIMTHIIPMSEDDFINVDEEAE